MITIIGIFFIFFYDSSTGQCMAIFSTIAYIVLILQGGDSPDLASLYDPARKPLSSKAT